MPLLTIACCIRSFKNLAYLSFIGQVMSFIGYFIIMCFSFMSLFETHPTITAVNWKGIPIFFGMVRTIFSSYSLVILLFFFFLIK